MSLYNVILQFIEFFVEGATIAPEILQLVAIVGTLFFIYFVIIYPIVYIIKKVVK